MNAIGTAARIARLALLAMAWGVAAGCAVRAPAPGADAPTAELPLVQFSRDAGLAGWHIENDDVMGGLSQSALAIDEAGNAVFSGDVSLENGGGFASIQCDYAALDMSACRAVCLGLKGDGKRYQLRVDAAKNARHSYACDFDTSGEWQVVEIPFADMYAIRHGDRLDRPNYPGRTLARLQILIGNGKSESFHLELDRIWLAK